MVVGDPRGLNHPIAHEEVIDGQEVGVYRASAVGYCEHALLAARMGLEPAAPPDNMQKVFSEGHDNEAIILARFYTDKKYLERGSTWGVGLCELAVGSTILVRGHVDDAAQHGPIKVIVEVKALGDSLWKEWLASSNLDEMPGLWQKYRDQIEVYMAATKADECAFVVGHKIEGVVREIHMQWVKPDPVRLSKIKVKLAMIEQRARAGAQLPAECDNQQYPCPYYYLMHNQTQKPTTIKLENEKLALALADYYQSGIDEKAGKKRRDDAKKVIDQEYAILAAEDDGRANQDDRPVYECGGYTVEYNERDMPAGTRKAYTQKYYTVKKTG